MRPAVALSQRSKYSKSWVTQSSAGATPRIYFMPADTSDTPDSTACHKTSAGRRWSKVLRCEATLPNSENIFVIFWGPHSHPLCRLRWNFVQPSGPTCLSAMRNLTWISITSRPCGAKNLILGLLVILIPAVCRFAAILPVIRNQKHRHATWDNA